MDRPPELNSGDPDFKSHSDFQLDLFQAILGSTSALPKEKKFQIFEIKISSYSTIKFLKMFKNAC